MFQPEARGISRSATMVKESELRSNSDDTHRKPRDGYLKLGKTSKIRRAIRIPLSLSLHPSPLKILSCPVFGLIGLVVGD